MFKNGTRGIGDGWKLPHRLPHFGMALLFLGVLLTYCVPEASGQVTSYPYSESFEVGSQLGPWGAWTRAPRTSDPRWKRDNLTTSSSSTGPNAAYNGSYYIYLETSGGSTGDTDYATATFNFSSLTVPQMTFYYHMYGAAMGTLAVEASLDNGVTWMELWSMTGQQHSAMTTAWTQASISLCSFAGQSNVKIRFVGVRGTSFTSDMAVDYVQVFQGTANPATYISSTAAQASTTPVSAGSSGNEIIGASITMSGDCPSSPVTSFTFNTNGSTNPSADIDYARLWYTASSGSFATAVQFGSAVANPNGSFTFTDNLGVSGGDNYFWLTYELDANATANNVVDAQWTSVTVGGIPRTPTVTNPAGSRSIVIPMSGTYTINATGTGVRNFTTFGAAITQLSVAGVAAPVVFNVASGSYNEQLTLVEVPGASATNTITFNGGIGNVASRIVTNNVSTSYQAVITFDGGDYFKFKNLTINSTNSSYGYGFLFTNQASNNEISNCVINLPTNTTSSYHIGIVASSTSSYSAYGDWGDNNLIKDNEINSGYYGIRWNGYSSTTNTTYCYNNQFIGNTVQDWYYYGIYIYYSAAVKVNENTVTQRRTGSTTTSGYGIYSYYANLGPQFNNNYIDANIYGLNPRYCNYNYTTTAPNPSAMRAQVMNNMIVVQQSSTSTIYAFGTYYSRYADIGFNSVNIIRTGASGTTYAVYHGGTSSNYDTKFKNNYISYSGPGTVYMLYNTTVGDQSENDFNAFWSSNGATESYYWGTTYSSLAALQAAVSGYHQNSVWGDPYFVATTNLHSRSHVGYQAGVPFAGVTTDYDGQTRGAAPCIGADEYPAPPPEYDLSIADMMLGTAEGKWARQEGSAMHPMLVVLENSGLSPDPATVDVTYKIGSMPAYPGDGVQETFTPAWTDGKALVEFTQRVTGLAIGPVVAYAKIFWAQDQMNANDGASGAEEVFSQKVHGYRGFDHLDPTIFPFTREPGFLDLPWDVVDNNGGQTLEILDGTGVGGSQAVAMIVPTEAADEWMITPGAELLAGSSYRLAFDFQNSGGSPVTIEAAFGETPDPSQMTIFATFANIAPGGFMTAKQLAGGLSPYFNTPMYDGTFYVALHFTTSGTNAQFALDNIKLDDNPSPPPKIAFGLPGTDLSTFIDNPATKITLIANYKSPGVINRTYEVQSKTNIYGALGDFLWDVESATQWITLTKETPNPTEQNYNFSPPRPRQFQTFTLSVNPSGLAPGTHIGEMTFYGILFNDDYLPPNEGLVATNEPLTITVELKIVNAGSKGGPTYIEGGVNTVMTVPGSPYDLVDVNTGDPIATVHVTSGQINSMTIRAYPNQLPQNIARMLYVKRYWQVTYKGTGWTADITFPYSDQEASMISDKSQLRSVRQAVPLGAWESPTNGTTSASDVVLNMVRVSGFSPANIDGNLALAHPYQYAGKEPDAGLPEAFTLEQNYPNPFNPTTNISFTVAEERHVRIAVYNSLGAEMAELVNEVLPAGRYDVAFDASALPSGTYLYRMMSGGFVATQRMTLSK